MNSFFKKKNKTKNKNTQHFIILALALMTFIKNVYGVEFSIEILDAYPSILLLSQKLQEGIEALIIIEAPFQSEELEDKKNQ